MLRLLDNLSNMLAKLDDDAIALLADLARTRTIRVLARESGVPRATLSYRLSRIESQLGRDLFVRRGRRLVPTHFGSVVFASAASAHEAMRKLDAALAGDAHAEERLAIAVAPLMAETLLPGVIARLKKSSPRLRASCA